MKIRADFVTNSSSTSYVIINNGSFSLDKFLKAIGVNEESNFSYIYKELFNSFKNNMKPLREEYERGYFRGSYDSFEDFVEKGFYGGKQLLKKIKLAEEKGYDVYTGSLDSDNTMIEAFFCCEDFIIESEDLYVHARDDAW